MRIEVNVWICIPILVVVYLLRKRVLHKLHNLPPTPFLVLPLIGHLYLLKKPLHRSLAELSKCHGPLLYLQLGSRQVLHVSSSLVAEECLSKTDIIFANRPHLLSGKYFGYNYTSLPWAPYGDHWQNLRRISALEILSSSRLEALSHIRLDETRSLLGRLFLAANENPNQILDLRSELFGLMFNVMTRMMGGKSFYGLANGKAEDGKRFQDIVTATSKINSEAGIVDMFPNLLGLVAGKLEKRYAAVQKRRDDFMQEWIDEFRADGLGDREGKKTFLKVLLSLLMKIRNTTQTKRLKAFHRLYYMEESTLQ